MKSLLHSLGPTDVVTDPFPHVIVYNALPSQLCDDLVKSFPINQFDRPELTLGASNKRVNLTANESLSRTDVPEIWKEMVRANSGPEFFEDFCRIFKPHILREYPNIESLLNPFEQLELGIRYSEGWKDLDIALDAQLAINTAVKNRATSVRRGHVDDYRKLYAGLLYLRPDDDCSTGGDLELCVPKKGKGRFDGVEIADSQIDVFKTVPYKKNTFVLLLNTPRSIHAVTRREVGAPIRQFFNLIAETRNPLFSLAHTQETLLEHLMRNTRYTLGTLKNSVLAALR